MVKYDKNFSTVCNDLVEFSETTETLAFTKRNALLGYQKSTDTDFIFCPDGTPVNYKEEGIVEHLKVYVSAWENTAKTGLPYISLRATVAPRKQDQDEDKLDEKVKFS